MARHYYTEEQDRFLIDNVKGKPYAELTKLFNETYGTNIVTEAIYSKIRRLGCSNGLDARIKKGNVPWNKGLKGLKVKNSGQFQPGHKPPNYNAVGSERVKKGRVFVKVSDVGKESERWRPKQEVIWESFHGAIPEGHLVIFLDGDLRNFDIDNLTLISRKIHLRLNQKKMRFTDKELTLAGINVCKLIDSVQAVENVKSSQEAATSNEPSENKIS